MSRESPSLGWRPAGVRMVACVLAGLSVVAVVVVVPAGAGAGSGLVRWSAPRAIIASEPNVPTAINASGQAITLRPLGAPSLQLMTARGPVRTVALQSKVPGYNAPGVAIADDGSLATVWDTYSGDSGAGPDRIEVAVGSFSLPPTRGILVPTGKDGFQSEQVYETSAGTAVFLWTETLPGGQSDSVRALIVPKGTAIPAPVTLDPGAELIGAGVDGKGEVVVIDEAAASPVEHLIAPDGTIGAAQPFSSNSLASAPGGGTRSGVLIDGAGDQLYYSLSNGRGPLYVQWRSAVGALGPKQLLGNTDAGIAGEPPVAINGAGDAVAVLSANGAGPLSVRFASRLGRFAPPLPVGALKRFNVFSSVGIDGSGRSLITGIDFVKRDDNHGRAVYAEAHGTRLGAPAPLAFQPGIPNVYRGDAPLASAAPNAAQTVVTYAGGTSFPIGQIAFPLS
jgi:hypothetical protein